MQETVNLPEHIKGLSLEKNIDFTIFVNENVPYNYYETEDLNNISTQTSMENHIYLENFKNKRESVTIYLNNIDSISLNENANLNGIILQKDKKIYLVNTGTGNIKLEGQAKHVCISILNKGYINTNLLEAETGLLKTRGGGNIYANIQQSFEFEQIGAGNIFVNTNTQMKQARGIMGKESIHHFMKEDASIYNNKSGGQLNDLNEKAIIKYFEQHYKNKPAKDITQLSIQNKKIETVSAVIEHIQEVEQPEATLKNKIKSIL